MDLEQLDAVNFTTKYWSGKIGQLNRCTHLDLRKINLLYNETINNETHFLGDSGIILYQYNMTLQYVYLILNNTNNTFN